MMLNYVRFYIYICALAYDPYFKTIVDYFLPLALLRLIEKNFTKAEEKNKMK